MKKIKKTDFLKIYENLKVVQGLIQKNKEEIFQKIKETESPFFEKIGFKTQEKNPKLDGTIYHENINNRDFYFMEQTIDYSKDSNCSWNDIQTWCVVFTTF